ncbi:hypothetical protein ACJIZ3_023488 [Penstemon smallii]|uniref:Inhibitor I9 domain-containing protein n=1 Tax=Penstemon smallii TaxID=265156 RepID=A0ABD3TRJ8_9LAMI
MGNLDGKHKLPSSHHINILQEVVDISLVRQSLVRSYTRSFNGFAAYLTPQEQEKLAGKFYFLLHFSQNVTLFILNNYDFSFQN